MKLTEIYLENLIREVLDEVKSKKTGVKKQCIKGNPSHSATTGEFTNPYKEKGSWSIGKGDTSGNDCAWGQASRKQPNRSTQFVKRKCGRNAKFRCKDGSVKEGELIEDYMLGPSGEVLAPDLKNVSETDLLEEIQRRVNEGSMSTAQILRLCSFINQSAAGDFPKAPK